jgi:hypothetical protein
MPHSSPPLQIEKGHTIQSMWHQVLAAVGQSVQDQYKTVQANMEAEGVNLGDPDHLPGIVARLDPETTLQQLQEANPNLNLTDPTSNHLAVTLELISLLSDQNS